MSSTLSRLTRCSALLLFLAPFLSSAQSWQAAMALPTAAGYMSNITDIAPDGAGGYVVTGGFTRTLTLGSTVLTSAGNQDIFVARFDAANQCTQAVRVGGTGYDRAAALALDASGTVTIVGDFASPSIAFGSTTLTNAAAAGSPSSSDVLVARLSAAGQWVQAVRAGGPSYDQAEDVALDPNGSTVVVGSFVGGAASFGTIALTSLASSGAGFVARLGSTGTWTQALTPTSNGSPHYLTGVAVDASGNALVCGYLYSTGTLTLGGSTVSNFTASTIVYVARLSRAGAWTLTAQSLNSGGFAYSGPIAVDAAGNVAIGGTFFDNSIRFGAATLTYSGTFNSGTGQSSRNLFVARLSNTGTWTYAAQATGTSDADASALAFDLAGNVLVTGYFQGASLTLGGTTFPNVTAAGASPSADIFLARLNSAGAWTYGLQAGGPGAWSVAPWPWTAAGRW